MVEKERIMKQKKYISIAVIGLLIAVATVWASQDQKEEMATSEPTKTTVGRFSVSSSGDSTVLLDTSSGKTWMLAKDVCSGKHVWLSTKARIDAPETVQRFLNRNEEYKRSMLAYEERQSEEREERKRLLADEERQSEIND